MILRGFREGSAITVACARTGAQLDLGARRNEKRPLGERTIVSDASIVYKPVTTSRLDCATASIGMNEGPPQ
jgi:hypothetical protein